MKESQPKPSMKDKMAIKMRTMADKLQHIESKEVMEERRRKDDKTLSKYESKYEKDLKNLKKVEKLEEKDRKKLDKDRKKLESYQAAHKYNPQAGNTQNQGKEHSRTHHPYIPNVTQQQQQGTPTHQMQQQGMQQQGMQQQIPLQQPQPHQIQQPSQQQFAPSFNQNTIPQQNTNPQQPFAPQSQNIAPQNANPNELKQPYPTGTEPNPSRIQGNIPGSVGGQSGMQSQRPQ